MGIGRKRQREDRSRQREERLTSVLAARLVQVLAARGVDLAPFSLPADALQRRDLEVTRATLRALADAAVAAAGDPALGLTLGRGIGRGAYGLVEFVARSSRTLREALKGMIRYQRLTGAGERYTQSEDRGVAALEHRGFEEIRVANEHAVSVALEIGHQLTGERWRVHRAWFAHPRPADLASWIDYLGTDQLEFDAPRNGFAFDATWLDRPVRTADAPLNTVLEEQAHAALEQRPGEDDVVAQVREQVRLSLREGTVHLERVASRLAFTGRTLQRKLGAHRLTFQDVVDDVRKTLARLYLANPRLGLAEVAFLLGYSDLRAFLRAHKRWTGTTPAEARRSS